MTTVHKDSGVTRTPIEPNNSKPGRSIWRKVFLNYGFITIPGILIAAICLYGLVGILKEGAATPGVVAPIAGSSAGQAPIAGKPSAPAPGNQPAEVSASSPLQDRVKVAESLPSYGLATITANDTAIVILDRFKAEWMNSVTGNGFKPETRYLWSFMDTSTDLYKQASRTASTGLNSTAMGQIVLSNNGMFDPDPQAAAGATKRTYLVDLYVIGHPEAKRSGVTMTIALEAGHWIITDFR